MPDVVEALEDLFLHELRDLRTRNPMAQSVADDGASCPSDRLRHGLEEQLQRTRKHVARLNQLLDQVGESADGTKGEAIVRLIAEGQQTIDEEAAPRVTDAGLIAAAQRVEHYEVAGYDTACSCARLLGDRDAERLLKQTLHEIQEADQPLSELADSDSGAECTVISTVFGDVWL